MQRGREWYKLRMKKPLYVRELSPLEIIKLKEGLRSPSAFSLKRCQILLASAEGKVPSQIAGQVGCVVQTVRNALKAFNRVGLECLTPQSSRPQTSSRFFDQSKSEALGQLLKQSPRTYGQSSSLWTLEVVAQVCFETGLTEQLVSNETIRRALKALGIKWLRAKHWISSPDPAYSEKKSDETAC